MVPSLYNNRRPSDSLLRHGPNGRGAAQQHDLTGPEKQTGHRKGRTFISSSGEQRTSSPGPSESRADLVMSKGTHKLGLFGCSFSVSAAEQTRKSERFGTK